MSKGVFVGVGPAADVDRYLAGAHIEVVKDFETTPFRLAAEPRAVPPSGSGTAPVQPAQRTGVRP